MNYATVLSLLGVALVIIILFFTLTIFIAGWTLYALFKTKVPFAKTPRENIAKIFNEISLPKNSLIYDLGCGDGRFLFAAEKLGYRAIGYELSLYPYLKCLLKKFFKKSSIKIFNKNFLKADLTNADAVFIFLVAGIMARVGDKLKKNLKPNTPVISYGFSLSGWRLVKTVNTASSKIYFYNT